jgi:transposase
MADDENSFESSFETSGGKRPQRMDVIPAGAGRRRWSAEAKARVVAESFAPGANISEVARRHGMMPQQLYGWRRGMRPTELVAFVPAVVEGAPDSAQAAIEAGEIIVTLEGATVRVPAGVSADHIERVLLAVRVSA